MNNKNYMQFGEFSFPDNNNNNDKDGVPIVDFKNEIRVQIMLDRAFITDEEYWVIPESYDEAMSWYKDTYLIDRERVENSEITELEDGTRGLQLGFEYISSICGFWDESDFPDGINNILYDNKSCAHEDNNGPCNIKNCPITEERNGRVFLIRRPKNYLPSNLVIPGVTHK